MFQRISKSLVKEVGRNDLTPVESPYRATKLRQFAVLQKTKYGLSFFWEKYDYVPRNFFLSDILESSSSVPDNDVNGPLYFRDTMIQEYKAGTGVNVGGELSVSGGHSADQGGSLGYQIVTISAPNLDVFQKRKRLHPEPEYLEQCRMKGDDLYVVTDIVELTRDTVLYDYSSIDLILKISSWITGVKGEVLGSIFRENKKVLTLKKGMVMAYKAKQLIFEEEDRTIHITDDYRRCTFQNVLIAEICAVHSGDFKSLHGEVSRNIEALAQLSRDVQGVVFSSILVMLRGEEDLQNLMYMLELDSSGHLDGPGGAILKILQRDSNHAWSKSKEAILYLLEAIMVLSDIQHDLLAYSMEKRILLQQQELVRSILEPNLIYRRSNPFTLKPELLAPLQREDLAITYGLLEGCGLRMELDSPKSTWNEAVMKPLFALYGTLSLLQPLAEA
ncbi:gasdermin-C [Callithrix jacchus]